MRACWISIAMTGAFVLLAEPSALRAQCANLGWVQRTSAASPHGRSEHAMAYDSRRGVTVLFGGVSYANGVAVEYGDTWEWNGISWTLRATSGPSARSKHAMAYDSRRGVTVLFGGYTDAGANCADTWEWDGATWTQAASCAGPVPMYGHAMAYDSRRGVTVLFGGTLSFDALGNTWEWDGTTWTKRATSGAPPRLNFPMAYDSARGVCVLFGGQDPNSDTGFADAGTWEWDGTAWALRATSGPEPRIDAAMAYDSNNGACILTGGGSNTTYAWDGTVWTACSSGIPPTRVSGAMAFDSSRLATVLFGGSPNYIDPAYGDTWELQPPLQLYVDWTNFGLQIGSSAFPFRTVRQAIDSGGNGTTISIRAGDYRETPITFSRRGRIVADGGVVSIH